MKKNVSDAYNKIHELGVIHGDIRKENILVREDKSIVIVDFDHTMVNNVSERLIDLENHDVNGLLSSLQS
jgi:RIO-like serine/threonine protein kinase